MDRALNYVALARKGSMIELGEEPVGAVARASKARLIVVASDASDHTWRRALSFVSGTEQQCIRIPYTKEQLGFIIGRSSLAIAAFTDAALALAFVKALPDPERYQQTREILDVKAQKLRQRQDEARAHCKNVRTGHHKPGKKD